MRLLALDGGGSKTVALLCDEGGRVLGRGRGGPSNLSFVSSEAAAAAITSAVRGALESCAPEPVDVAACGGPVLPELMGQTVRGLLPAAQYAFYSEADCCLACANGATSGAVVLAGTGSFEFARSRADRSHRTDGWGALFGDEGSAHDIARAALRAAVRAEDGRGRATLLREAALDHFGCETLRQVSRRIYGERMPRHQIARLAPRVTALAERDPEARRIVEAAAKRLAEGVLTCLRKTDMLDDDFDLVLSGGVFRAGAVIVEPLRRAVLAQAPGARLLRPRFEPVYGALRLGFAAAGIAWTAATEQRFERSLTACGAAADVLTGGE